MKELDVMILARIIHMIK